MPQVVPRRGFPTEANWWAKELRQAMGVPADSPLDPWSLCSHLEVPVFRLSQLQKSPMRDMLLEPREGYKFFAALCFEGTASFILLNDATDRKRQASDLAHEVAHLVLGHTPMNPFDSKWKREFSAVQEAEAEILGPALLVSEQAALLGFSLILNGRETLSSLSNAWGISEPVLRMRFNKTAANKRIRRAA